jgi:hypothetical protein
MIPLPPSQLSSDRPDTQLKNKIGECVAIACALEGFEGRISMIISRLRGPKPVGPGAAQEAVNEPIGSLIRLHQILCRSHTAIEELLAELESLV